MSHGNEPIAVTGIGVVCALGGNLDTVMARLVAGESGVRDVTLFDTASYNCKRAAQIAGFEPPPMHELSATSDRAEQLLAHVVNDALAQADLRALPVYSSGLVLGTTVGGLISASQFLDHWARRDRNTAPMPLIAQNFPSHQLAHTAQRFALWGPQACVNNACASGADAIGTAVSWLRRGRADVMVAGGYDPLAEFTFAGFVSLKLVTKQGCRPFAEDRDGFHLGEAAAVLVLERVSDARRRGAAILGYVLGHGSAAEAHHLTHPDPTGGGGARAMQKALHSAGLTAVDVRHINVHGTASPANDRSEFLAMQTVFGGYLPRVPVTGNKPALGHTLGAAGALEAALTLGSLRRRSIPPTLHTGTPAPEFAGLDLVCGEPRAFEGTVAMSNSFGFGGSCASLILATEVQA
jgi:3-oxoacyl-[acyl-carrier-protein] synthase II